MRRAMAIRVVSALAIVGAGLGIGLSAQPAEADDPGACGYARYDVDPTSTTSTVPGVPFCERPCWGLFVHVPPTHVQDVHFELLACFHMP